MCEQNQCCGAQQSPADFKKIATRYSIDTPSLLTVVEPRDGQPLEIHLVPDNTRRQSQDFVDGLQVKNDELENYNRTLNERCAEKIRSAARDIFKDVGLDTLVTDITSRFVQQRDTIRALFNQRDIAHKEHQDTRDKLDVAESARAAFETKLKELFRELAQSKAHAERGWDRVATRGKEAIQLEEKLSVAERRLKAYKDNVTAAHDLLTRAGVPLGGALIVRLARVFDENNNSMNAYANSVKVCHDFLDTLGAPKEGSVLVRFKRMLALQGQCGCTTCEATTKDNEIARLNKVVEDLERDKSRLENEQEQLKSTVMQLRSQGVKDQHRINGLENQLADIRESAKVL